MGRLNGCGSRIGKQDAVGQGTQRAAVRRFANGRVKTGRKNLTVFQGIIKSGFVYDAPRTVFTITAEFFIFLN